MAELDEYFVDTDQYEELEDEKDIRPVEIIQQKDIKLICYQWFKPDTGEEKWKGSNAIFWSWTLNERCLRRAAPTLKHIFK